jgi:hypothetical protein
MRHALLLILGIFLTGCTTYQDKVPLRSTSVYYEPAPAAALAFEPPMVAHVPLPSFSREGRAASAFYGYEQPVIDISEIYQRDSQRGEGYPDYFDRTARSGRISTTYR